MKRITAVVLGFLIYTVSACVGQTPYALKDDVIGESIQTFHQLHRGAITPPFGLAGYLDYLHCTGNTDDPPPPPEPEPQPPVKPKTGMWHPYATDEYQLALSEWADAYFAWKDRAAAAQALAESRADARKQFLAHEPSDDINCHLTTTIAGVPATVIYSFTQNRLDNLSGTF